MRITVYSDYSLRLLMFLAIAPQQRGTISAIAGYYGISRAHIVKVVHELAKAGYLETTRGRGGGMRLARPPEVISVGEVLRITEPDFNLAPCFETAHACKITPSCVLKKALADATRAFLGSLDTVSLADLAQPADTLRRDLGLTSFQVTE